MNKIFDMYRYSGEGYLIYLMVYTRVICILIFLFISGNSYGQNGPVFGQFFTNPYLINPSYVGIEGRPAMFLSYRQQWMGVDGAPKSGNFNFHTPLTNGLSLGLNFFDDSRSLLHNDVGTLTLGYAIGITKKEYIRFGMSAGAGFRRFDIASADTPDDPALGNINENSTFLAGNVGISFHSGYFSVGFSLPQIFDSDITPTTSFPTEIKTVSPLDRYIINASYRFYFGLDEMAFEPHLVYYAYKDLPSQWEAAGIFHIKYNLWAGASYRQDYGLSGLVGIKMGGSFSLGYSYTVPSEQNSIGIATHEIQLGLLLKKNKRRKNQMLSFVNNERIYWKDDDETADDFFVQDTEVIEKPVDEVVEPIDTTETSTSEDIRIPRVTTEESPVIDENKEPLTEENEREMIIESGERYEVVETGEHMFELLPGNYIVVGAFQYFENAEKYSDQLYRIGQVVKFGYNSQRGLWHVYIFMSNTLVGIRDELGKVRQVPQLKEAWLLTVE
ncbi:PorP/SprF family type IX secretion system membrane protein [Bacteroidota bacterium]